MSSLPKDASDETARGAPRRPPSAPGEATASLFFRRLQREQVLPGASVGAGRVVGDYRLLALLGRGGMGQVWEAEQISLGGRRVAVKFVRPDRVTPRQIELFQREARAGGRLHHSGIVEVHAYGECDGLAWIAMELVDGAWTLRDSIDEVARSGEAPPDYDRAAARLVAEIADAMQAAHQAGVIHRDLKPQNVLIAPDERPKVTDFGLARISDEAALSQTGDFAGTYFYMSPEQITAKRVRIDHRTDVFSLGIILYEMLALRRPFQGDTSHQIAEQILVSEPPDPRSFRSRIAPELVAITGKALEKDRARRYESMAEFSDDLRRWLSHCPIAARPTPPWRRLAKWARRHPAKSGIASVAVLAFGVVSVLVFQLFRSNQSHAKTTHHFVRVSALQKIQDLEAEADLLWPPHREHIEGFESWIERARELVDELPQYRAELEELRSGSLAELDATRVSSPATEAESSASALDGTPERWLINQLARLIEALEALSDPKTGLLGPDAISPQHGWSLPKRLAFAKRLPDLERRWESDMLDIREWYGEPGLHAAEGLIPIGQDPHSQLFEFWHPASGEQPEREPDGELVLRPETGMVLVLVPAGRFLMGAQRREAPVANREAETTQRERPVHDVNVSLFYVGKFETTRAQWNRLSGADQDAEESNVALLPVVGVSWIDAMDVLTRFGLALPTEAQWEYACRAGSTTRYWRGDHETDLAEVSWYGGNAEGALHPVGERLANPFGLHDVHGNACEWCLDWRRAYTSQEQTDPVGPDASERVFRGGSYWNLAERCRSANREGGPAENRGIDLGFRVAFPAATRNGD